MDIEDPVTITSTSSTIDEAASAATLSSTSIVNSNEKDVQNGALLKYAAESDDYDTVKKLIESGVNVNQKDQFGDLPLHGAIVKCRVKIVKYLLSKGGDPNLANGVGSTSLHKLVSVSNLRDQFEMIELLMRHGADPTIRNNAGLIPEQLSNFSKIKEVLQGDQLVTIRVHVDRVDHGKVIGKGGKKLHELRELTNTQINIPAIKDADQKIEIKGRKDDVEDAKQRILQLIKPKEKDANTKAKEEEKEQVEITLLKIPNIAKEHHRLIIGTGGATIKRLRDEFKVKITIPPPGAIDNFVEIQGVIEDVEKAIKEINKIIGNHKQKQQQKLNGNGNYNNNNNGFNKERKDNNNRPPKDNNKPPKQIVNKEKDN